MLRVDCKYCLMRLLRYTIMSCQMFCFIFVSGAVFQGNHLKLADFKIQVLDLEHNVDVMLFSCMVLLLNFLKETNWNMYVF